MATYVKTVWNHQLPSEPLTILSEINDARMEIRKVEVFTDGRHTFADAAHDSDETGLSEEPFPPLAELADEPEIVVVEIDAAEFETAWRIATG